MDSTHEEAVQNFDLNFFSSFVPIRGQKKTCIRKIKKRIFATDELHNRYLNAIQAYNHATKEIENLKEINSRLESISHEHENTSLEYKELLETIAKRDKADQIKEDTIKRLNEELFKAVNRAGAAESHAVQLEQLVKQQTQSDRTKVDKMIEDRVVARTKELQKGLAVWKKKYETLHKKNIDKKSNKRKINTDLLQKHDKFDNDVGDPLSFDEHSDDEDAISVDVTLPFAKRDSSLDVPGKCPTTNKDNMRMESDSDCNNEVVSIDTGCGSSLASSDNEKWLNSPDYVFSPVNVEKILINHKRKLVDTGTSPIRFTKMVEVATSPPPSVNMSDSATNPMHSVKMIDVATSPSTTLPIVTYEDSGSPIDILINDDSLVDKDTADSMSISPVTNITQELDTYSGKTVESIPSVSKDNNKNENDEIASGPISIFDNPLCIKETQEKECLESNSSNKISEDCTSDNEIEMILNAMRLSHKIITPIPRTPGKPFPQASTQVQNTQTDEAYHSVCQDAAIARAQAQTAREEAAAAREEIAKTREDNRKLMTDLANLMKDMFNVKSFLKNRFCMPDVVREQSDSTSNLLNNENAEHLIHNESINKFAANKPINQCANNINESVPDSNLDTLQVNTAPSQDNEITRKSDNILETPDVDNVRNTEDENRSLPKAVQMITPDIPVEQNKTSNEVNKVHNSADIEMIPSTKNTEDKKTKKSRKVTNLFNYRKRCESYKFKIREKTPPLVKPAMKPKQVRQLKIVTESDTSATLNDTTVYVKAVKVMAELNAKAKSKRSIGPVPNTKSQERSKVADEHSLSDIRYKPDSHEEFAHIAVRRFNTLTESSINSPETAVTSSNFGVTSSKPTMMSFSHSVMSPEHAVISPKTATTSRSRSLRSPEFTLTSPTTKTTSRRSSIKSSELSLTSPTTVTTSRSSSIKSPELTLASPTIATTSRKSSIKSPELTLTSAMTATTSRNSSIKSSELTLTSPISATTSRRSSIKSPELTLTSPMTVTTSRSSSIKSPELTLTSPTPATSRRSSIKSSEFTLAPPMTATTCQESFIKSPEFGLISPPNATIRRHSIKLPECETMSPIPDVTVPWRSIRSPELAVILSKIDASVPKNVCSLSNSEDTSLKSVMTSTTDITKSPEFVTVHSAPATTSQKCSITSSEVNVVSQTATSRTRRCSIRSPKFTMVSPTPSITSPTQLHTHPENASVKPNDTASEGSLASPRTEDNTQEPNTTPSKSALISRRGSIRSPEFTMMTPKSKSAKNCGRHFIKSSEVISVSSQPETATVITSPDDVNIYLEPDVSPSKSAIRSRRESITSPELGLASPKTAITYSRCSTKSPVLFSKSYLFEEDDLSSPGSAITVAEHAINSPDFTTTSPSPANLISPKLVPTSPQPAITSIFTLTTEPKDATGFDIQSPTLTDTSPKFMVTSPPPSIKSPEFKMTPIKPAFTYSRRCVRSPKLAPKPEIKTLNENAPRALLFYPGCDITAPELTVTSARPRIASPKLATATANILPMPIKTSPMSLVSNENQCVVLLSKNLKLFQDVSHSSKQNSSKVNFATNEQSTRKRRLSTDTQADTQAKRVLRNKQLLNGDKYTTQNDETTEISSLRVTTEGDATSWHPKESILCSMIQKYGVKHVKPFARNVPDSVLDNVRKSIERYLLKIKEASGNKESIMRQFVDEIQKCNYKNFVAGLMKYLTMPERKNELFAKTSQPPVPQMTKSEEVLLYILKQLRNHWRPVDIVDILLSSMEFTLFKLNRTPDFDVVESVSHLYALVCRYFNEKSRLITFMLDAMYCILFKSVPLVRQCLDVWPHVIPLAHMSAAKTPLVTCFVYLLHFYKCEDRFNRVQDIRNILNRKYFYEFTDWNETKILELFSNSIKLLRDVPNEKKMLRIALIILAKRNGPKWTQNNIVKKLLQSFIENENEPDHVKQFCVAMIGPIMKPYPADMKVHCEIALNQLMGILNTTTTRGMEEAAISSMILMSRHNQQRVNETLLSRKMQPMSPEVEELIRDYVRLKSLNTWMKTLSKRSE